MKQGFYVFWAYNRFSNIRVSSSASSSGLNSLSSRTEPSMLISVVKSKRPTSWQRDLILWQDISLPLLQIGDISGGETLPAYGVPCVRSILKGRVWENYVTQFNEWLIFFLQSLKDDPRSTELAGQPSDEGYPQSLMITVKGVPWTSMPLCGGLDDACIIDPSVLTGDIGNDISSSSSEQLSWLKNNFLLREVVELVLEFASSASTFCSWNRRRGVEEMSMLYSFRKEIYRKIS